MNANDKTISYTRIDLERNGSLGTIGKFYAKGWKEGDIIYR
jgi:hypothetical protein